MTLDEVIAANVKTLRKRAGIERSELAERLGVGLHVVRDYERPRKDQPQRAFSWQEIFALCAELGTTLFELVLPPEGAVVDSVTEYEDMIVRVPETGEPVGRIRGYFDSREEMGWILFGVGPELLTPDKWEAIAKYGQKELERREELVSRLSEEMLRRLQDYDTGDNR